MIKHRDIPEIIELEQEIDEFMDKMGKAEDAQEFEMYRQMIKLNICLIKDLLKKSGG